MKAIAANWPLIASLLGATFIFFGLKEKGLCRPRITKKSLISLTIILIAAAGFWLLVRFAVFSGYSGRDTFHFLAPLFRIIFRLDNEVSAIFSAIRPPAFFLGSVFIFLGGLTAWLVRKEEGRGAFWLAFSLALSLQAQKLLVGPGPAPRALSAIAHPLKIILYYSAAIFAAAIFSRYGVLQRSGGRESHGDWKRWGIILIILITVLTGFYRIEQHPITVSQYETDNGLSAFQIIGGDSVYSGVLWGYMERAYTASAFSPFFVYFLAGLFQVAGAGLTVLRSAGVFWGLGGLVIYYFMIKDLFGTRIALYGTFLVSTGIWFLSLSRLGAYSSLTLFYTLLVIYVFSRALKNNICSYALAGGLLGLNNYFYVIAKVIFPLLVLLWIHQIILNRKSFKNYLIGMALFLLFFFLVSALIADPFRQLTGVAIKNQYIGTRLSPGPGLAVSALLNDIKDNLFYLFQNLLIKNTGWTFPAPAAPLLDRNIFLLAILGMGICLGHWRRKGYFLLIIWMILVILPVTLISPLVDRGVGRRGILLIPVVSTLVAISLESIIKTAAGLIGKTGRILATAGIAVFLFVTALSNINIYFNAPEQASYHRGDREFAGEVVKHIRKGYYLEIVLDIHPQLADRIIDFFAYPWTGNPGAPFKYPPNPWGYPTREAKVGNQFYRYREASDFRETIAVLKGSDRKTMLLVGDSPINDQFMEAIREYEPSARFDEFYDVRGRLIGYRCIFTP